MAGFKGIDPTQALTRFSDEAVANDGKTWLQTLAHQSDYHEVVVMDVTASEELAGQYEQIAELGMHLICANKVAGSASTQDYLRIMNAFEKLAVIGCITPQLGLGCQSTTRFVTYVIVAIKSRLFLVFSQVLYLGYSNNLMAAFLFLSWSI